jgi:hypothetical protein
MTDKKIGDISAGRVLSEFSEKFARKGEHPWVLEIRRRSWFCGHKDLEKVRSRLIRLLNEAAPILLLEVTDWTTEPIEDLGEAFGSENHVAILLNKSLDIEKVFGRLYEGAWVLSFFSELEDVCLTPKPHGSLKNDKELVAVLQARHAKAMIVSWYDDLEWKIAIAPSSPKSRIPLID